MRTRYKFHAMAIAFICTAITGLYFLITPQQPAQPVDNGPQGDRYIQVDNATWGYECNDYIKEELNRRLNTPAPKNEKGEIIKLPPLELVTKNNVLPAISTLCNGKLSCSISADSALLGVEPQESCFKKLQVGYRCFAIEPLRSIIIDQRNSQTIDCNDAPAAASSAPTTPQAPQQ